MSHGNTLCVGNLPSSITENTLRQRFECYGKLAISIYRGKQRSIALVTYVDVCAAERALRAEDGKRLNGLVLCVSEYHP